MFFLKATQTEMTTTSMNRRTEMLQSGVTKTEMMTKTTIKTVVQRMTKMMSQSPQVSK